MMVRVISSKETTIPDTHLNKNYAKLIRERWVDVVFAFDEKWNRDSTVFIKVLNNFKLFDQSFQIKIA